MFELPRYVISHGNIVVEDGEIREDSRGKTLHAAPAYDQEAVPHIQEWFKNYYTIRFRNYPVDEHYLGEQQQVVPTR